MKSANVLMLITEMQFKQKTNFKIKNEILLELMLYEYIAQCLSLKIFYTE